MKSRAKFRVSRVVFHMTDFFDNSNQVLHDVTVVKRGVSEGARCRRVSAEKHAQGGARSTHASTRSATACCSPAPPPQPAWVPPPVGQPRRRGPCRRRRRGRPARGDASVAGGGAGSGPWCCSCGCCVQVSIDPPTRSLVTRDSRCRKVREVPRGCRGNGAGGGCWRSPGIL